jgi:hypothetical protein
MGKTEIIFDTSIKKQFSIELIIRQTMSQILEQAGNLKCIKLTYANDEVIFHGKDEE